MKQFVKDHTLNSSNRAWFYPDAKEYPGFGFQVLFIGCKESKKNIEQFKNKYVREKSKRKSENIDITDFGNDIRFIPHVLLTDYSGVDFYFKETEEGNKIKNTEFSTANGVRLFKYLDSLGPCNILFSNILDFASQKENFQSFEEDNDGFKEDDDIKYQEESAKNS